MSLWRTRHERRPPGDPPYNAAACIGAVLCVAVACVPGCGGPREEGVIGTKDRPLELAVPVAAKATPLGEFVTGRTGLVCRETEAGSLVDLLDLLDEGELDVMILSAPVYALVSEPYNLLAVLKARRVGTLEMRGLILVRADKGLVTVADAKGLTVAATDAASTSGCLLQRVLVTEQKATPSRVVYLGDEAKVVRAVYDGEADVGFVTWRLNADGNPDDARAELFDDIPDIFEVVVPLAVTRAVPHDAVAVRARVPDALRAGVADALVAFAATREGAAYLKERYGIEGLAPADDVEYAELRKRLRGAKVRLVELLPEEEEN